MEESVSLSDLEGEEWDKWIAVLGRDQPEDDEDSDVDTPKPEPLAECKRLPITDMMLFGFCPEVDPFYAVVCEYCENVVKPQFFSEHIALRHSECVKIKVKVKDGREDIKVVNNVSSKSRKHTSSSSSVHKNEPPQAVEKKSESSGKLINSAHPEKFACPQNTLTPVPVSSSSNKFAERRLFPANHSLPKLTSTTLCVNSSETSTPLPSSSKSVEISTQSTAVVPVANKVTPVANKVIPIVNKAVPVAYKVTPVAHKATPVANKAIPVTNKVTPVTNKATPVANKITTVVNKAVPVANKVSLVANKVSPVANKVVPIAKKVPSVVNKIVPVASKDAQVASNVDPITSKIVTISAKPIICSKSNEDNDSAIFLRPLDVDHELSLKRKKKAPPVKEKVYSPDIHCGVWNEQTKKNCLRALTCRTHSLLLKRAVPMRSKLFDVLLAEHRASNKAKKEKEEFTPLYIQTTPPVEPTPLVETPTTDAKETTPSATGGITFAFTGSIANQVYSWTVPEVVIPVVSDSSKNSSESPSNLVDLEPALPGPFLPAEPSRIPLLKPILPKPPSVSVLHRRYTSVRINESLYANVQAKPLNMCSLGLQNDGGFVGPHRRIGMLRRSLKAAIDDTGYGGPIRTDRWGFPMHSNIKTVLSNICGRAAQRNMQLQRNARLAQAAAARNAAKNNPAGSTAAKNSSVGNSTAKNNSISSTNNNLIGNLAAKNNFFATGIPPKNTTFLFKTFPVSSPAPVSKDTSKMTSVPSFLVKAQPKANLKRLAIESFKENDVVKSPRKSNPVINSSELFTKTSQQGSHVVAVAYNNSGKVASDVGGTSLLRSSERPEHGPGESLLVSNRAAVGLLTARPHSSVGDTLPQLPTGMTPNNVTTANADKPQEALRTTKGKGSLIRLSDSNKITKGKLSSQPMTCLTTSGQTMMLHQVLGPQVITQVQMTPKSGSTNLKFIPQTQTVSLAKTFLVKKDHGDT